jgi:hypothetical protein
MKEKTSKFDAQSQRLSVTLKEQRRRLQKDTEVSIERLRASHAAELSQLQQVSV